MVTIRKTKGFIDVSRAARCERNLQLLRAWLERGRGLDPAPGELSQERSLSLSRLDQGLGDLLRVVRSGKASGTGRPPRRASRAQDGAPSASRTNKGEK